MNHQIIRQQIKRERQRLRQRGSSWALTFGDQAMITQLVAFYLKMLITFLPRTLTLTCNPSPDLNTTSDNVSVPKIKITLHRDPNTINANEFDMPKALKSPPKTYRKSGSTPTKISSNDLPYSPER